jgi:ABC-2 type transport system permease protein
MSTIATSTIASASAGRGRDLRLLLWQIRYEQRSYWRNRGRSMFTFVFPLMFLVIFASLDKGQRLASRGNIPYDDFFVPGILAYGVITTTFTNLAAQTAILRDEGVLKRMQGTPLPRWAYMLARVLSTALVMVAMAAVVIIAGALFWGVHFRAGELPGVAMTLVLGAACFTMLGIGITRFIPNAESGPIVVNFLILPITFISNIWFPTDSLPHVLKVIAGIFPIKALADGLQFAFDPRHHGTPISGSSLETLAIWTVVGAWLMYRFLRQPQGEVA